MIVQRGPRSFVLYTHDGKRVPGRHPTYQKALAQERAIEAHKHARRNPGEAQRTWTEIGKKYNRTASQRGQLSGIFNRLTWRLPQGDFPMGPGLAIQEAIKEFRIPKVSRVAIDGSYLGRYGVYGIEGNFKNGRAVIYVLDRGGSLVPLASDFHPH